LEKNFFEGDKASEALSIKRIKEWIKGKRKRNVWFK
jgi:hypothetical protein